MEKYVEFQLQTNILCSATPKDSPTRTTDTRTLQLYKQPVLKLASALLIWAETTASQS